MTTWFLYERLVLAISVEAFEAIAPTLRSEAWATRQRPTSGASA
jgi:hypothetical protein